MIALEDSVAVMLCSGSSRRFGPGNKLLAPLAGKPLAAHAAEVCTRIPVAGRIAVIPRGEPALNALLAGFGFQLLVNDAPELGKDNSLRLGLAQALADGARGVLVLLGDMPHIEAAHLLALAAAASDGQAAISRAGGVLSPPTFIPADIARRAVERAPAAVRHSLGDPVQVAAPAFMLLDYDRPEQFGVQQDRF